MLAGVAVCEEGGKRVGLVEAIVLEGLGLYRRWSLEGRWDGYGRRGGRLAMR